MPLTVDRSFSIVPGYEEMDKGSVQIPQISRLTATFSPFTFATVSFTEKKTEPESECRSSNFGSVHGLPGVSTCCSHVLLVHEKRIFFFFKLTEPLGTGTMLLITDLPKSWV